MLEPNRAGPGNLRYDFWKDQSDPNRFVLDELYAEANEVAAHRATPHFQKYLSQIGDLAERAAFVLEPRLRGFLEQGSGHIINLSSVADIKVFAPGGTI